MKKLSIIIITILFSAFFLLTKTNAAEYSRTQSKVDTTISDQSTRQYSQPRSIYIVQITSQDSLMEKNPLSWFRTLYYYSITRLGYVDIPFTYVLDREGNIYDGRDGGDNVTPEIVDDAGGVVIGYLSNSTSISTSAQETLRGLVAKVSYTYGIPQKNLQVVDMEMVKQEGRSTKTSLKPLNNLFSQNVLTALEGNVYSEKEHIAYKAEVIETKYEKSVKAGEKLKVQVAVKNSNDFPWFTDKDYIYVSTKGSKNSKFAINGVWDSFSKPATISKKTILPGETLNIEFELQALLLPGKYSETYNITKSPNTIFPNTEFSVNFEIVKGNFKLVQVVNTPGGVLNVRECPSGSCKPLTQLDEGQVVIMVEKTLAGWYRIKYAEKKEGWVYGPYIKEL
ncbi:SH3 domain-containing protein [Candidatus Dojkabacteria bacterium]|nr:SH3 domain-containing protein [Candidatus Dojkabacteria bacterium]